MPSARTNRSTEERTLPAPGGDGNGLVLTSTAVTEASDRSSRAAPTPRVGRSSPSCGARPAIQGFANADNLRAFSFVGCPTVQQIMELTAESARTDFLMDTNGIDPWGMPYQVECDPDKVHVFSTGPDKQAGTADDIRWKH